MSERIMSKMEHWSSFMDTLSSKLESLQFVKEIINVKHENELMSHLFSKQEIIKSISTLLQNYHRKRKVREKSSEKSESFKIYGNKKFQAKEYIASLQLYTKSALYAPSDSKNLPIAIANRSASLLYLKRWQDCIKDIKLALKLGYPKDLCHKLYLRMAQCYLELNEKKLVIETLLQIDNVINECDMSSERKDQLQKKIDEIKVKVLRMRNNTSSVDTKESHLQPEVAFGENLNFPSASAGIEVKYAPQKGRYVVANKDIQRGQVLFVEKAFAFVPIKQVDVFDNICHNCCHSCDDIPVPCTGCTNVIFCNIDCRDKACSSYHRWECPGNQMDLWTQIGIAHLAIKILFMCAVTTDIGKFNEVQQLVTNFDKINTTDIIPYGITAAMLALYLSKYTSFFKDINLRESLISKFSKDTFNNNNQLTTEDDKQLYISSLLLKHILQLISNGHAITKLNTTVDNKQDNFYTQQEDRIATAIYPSASIMNHSCDPNIINSFRGQLLIVKAIKDIAAGEEVFHCYGTDFRRMPKTERQEWLKSQYCFTCICEPCTAPKYENFTEKFLALKCPKCSGPLLANSSAYCLDCGATTIINYVEKLKEAQDHFNEAEIAIENKKYSVALTYLKKCLLARQNVLYKYHDDIVITWDLIAKVYIMMEHWLDSILYLEYGIVAIKEKYGPSSIELCNEINKLTDISIQYLQQKSDMKTECYKNILKKTQENLNCAYEIIDFTYGPWHEIYHEIITKMKVFFFILQDVTDA